MFGSARATWMRSLVAAVAFALLLCSVVVGLKAPSDTLREQFPNVRWTTSLKGVKRDVIMLDMKPDVHFETTSRSRKEGRSTPLADIRYKVDPEVSVHMSPEEPVTAETVRAAVGRAVASLAFDVVNIEHTYITTHQQRPVMLSAADAACDGLHFRLGGNLQLRTRVGGAGRMTLDAEQGLHALLKTRTSFYGDLEVVQGESAEGKPGMCLTAHHGHTLVATAGVAVYKLLFTATVAVEFQGYSSEVVMESDGLEHSEQEPHLRVHIQSLSPSVEVQWVQMPAGKTGFPEYAPMDAINQWTLDTLRAVLEDEADLPSEQPETLAVSDSAAEDVQTVVTKPGVVIGNNRLRRSVRALKNALVNDIQEADLDLRVWLEGLSSDQMEAVEAVVSGTEGGLFEF